MAKEEAHLIWQDYRKMGNTEKYQLVQGDVTQNIKLKFYNWIKKMGHTNMQKNITCQNIFIKRHTQFILLH